MSEKANRLDRWKTLTAATVVADVSEYIGFAPMPFHRSRGMQATAKPPHTTLLTMLPLFSFALLFSLPFQLFGTTPFTEVSILVQIGFCT